METPITFNTYKGYVYAVVDDPILPQLRISLTVEQALEIHSQLDTAIQWLRIWQEEND